MGGKRLWVGDIVKNGVQRSDRRPWDDKGRL